MLASVTENGHWLLWGLLFTVSDVEDEMLGWHQPCPVDVKCTRNEYVSSKSFFSVFVSISPESVPAVGGASSLSGDGAVGYYSLLPFMSVSAPHPNQGDAKHSVMDT